MQTNNDLIVILFDINYKDPFSILCSIVTGSSYSHSAVRIGNKEYDNTFLRGHFSKLDITEKHPPKREVTLIRIKGVTGFEWLKSIKSSPLFPIKYDVWGLLMYPFGVHTKDKEYCFEAVNNCLSYYHRSAKRNNGRVSGKHILNNFIDSKDTVIIRTNIENYNDSIDILRHT